MAKTLKLLPTPPHQATADDAVVVTVYCRRDLAEALKASALLNDRSIAAEARSILRAYLRVQAAT